MRTRVYVDGFNLYHGALKGTPFKWLNLVELSHRQHPAGHAIERLDFFTAPGYPVRWIRERLPVSRYI